MPIEFDNVIYNKAAIIERSLKRMREEYLKDTELENFTYIDAMVLNIERACQAAIDLSNHIVAKKHLGIPQSSSDSFKLLSRNSIITEDIAKDMVGITGFRNIAIHEYQELNISILKSVAENKYESLVEFCNQIGIKIIL
ncbi:MAG: DUF86 domain-containing protein [Spirochaetales bacterium]|nr:DUF86 domain-containing protein [Spirochaetales bacterium]